MSPETNPEPQAPQTSANEPVPVDPTPTVMPQPEPAKSTKFDFLKGRKKLLLCVVLVLVMLAGASATAYYTLVLPNKPDNKLLKAFTKLAGQNQVTVTSKIDYQDKKATSGIKGFTLDFDTGIDLDKTLVGISGKVGVSGTQFPFEMRVVDENIYLKVSGLGSIDNLLPPGSENDKYLQTLATLNDQWFVIDRSFSRQMDQSNSCSSSLTFDKSNFSEDDINKIKDAYKKHSPLKVKSTSSEQVDGVSTTKMELESADSGTLKKFVDELKSVGSISKLNKCLESAGVDTAVDQKVKPTNVNYKVHAFVTNDKQLKRLTVEAEDDTRKFNMTFDFSDQIDNVTKPEGAKPIQDLLGGLLGSFYNSSDLLNAENFNSPTR